MTYHRERNSAFGHICNGGGAHISNSPINITVQIIVQTEQGAQLEDDTGRPTKLGKTIQFLKHVLQGQQDRERGDERPDKLIEIDDFLSRAKGPAQ